MHLRNLILGLAATLALPAMAQATAAPAVAVPAGDAAKGEATFKAQCGICHVAVDDSKPHPGPLLAGVVGRKAAAIAGFNYSPALKASGKTWTLANLDQFLANAQGAVPGTFMVVKLGNPAQRGDVLAYLTSISPAAGKKK